MQQKEQNDVRTTLPRTEVEDCIMSLALLDFAHAASLLELTSDSVRFSHQLLQEFFTAQRFGEERRNGLQASSLWKPEKWWEANGWEVAAELAVEYETDPKPFLKWLAAGQPKLAANIAREQGLLDDTLFAEFRPQWQNAITDIEHYPNPHERHAISSVLAWLNWDNRPGLGIDDIDWVEIDGYKMSRYPVTNAQFRAFVVAEDGYGNDGWWQKWQKPETPHESYWKENNRPVEQVNWYEAMAFCRWLSKKLDLDIRLPTEEQWEKAARGTDGREYPWGDGYKMGYANIDETYGEAGIYNLEETSAVGIYPQGQSPYGLMDMSGNVWEWCLNKWDDPQITDADISGGCRVVRGGAWDFYSGNCRSSSRGYWLPRLRDPYRGFRLCCVCSPIDHCTPVSRVAADDFFLPLELL